MSKIYRFFVPGVSCGGCAVSIEGARCVSDEITIENIHVNIADKTVDVTVADSLLPPKKIKAILIQTVDAVGFECFDKSNPVTDLSVRHHVIKGVIGIIAGSVLLGFCVSGLSLPLVGLYALAACSTSLTLYLGKETYYAAAKSLFARQSLTMDTLFSISTLIALAISLTSLFVPWLPMMYDSALLIFGFSHIGKAVRERVTHEIEKNLRFRSDIEKTREIDVESPAGPQKKRINDLLPGDVILIRHGEELPVDGECLNESATIYDKSRSGRTEKQPIKKGDELYAGASYAENVGTLSVKVKGSQCSLFLSTEPPETEEEFRRITQNFQNNAYVLVNNELYYIDKYNKTRDKIAITTLTEFKNKFAANARLAANEKSRCLFEKLTREQLILSRSLLGHTPEPDSFLAALDAHLDQPGEKAPLEKTANTLMKYFVPTVLVLTLISAVTIGTLFSPLTAVQCAVAILVSACPCTFGLITPLAIKIGLNAALAKGIFFKSGEPLQAAQEVDIVLLDLNGTLTKGLPEVTATNIPDHWLSYLAVLERQTTHSFAKTIHNRFKSSDNLSLTASTVDTSNHSGVSATIAGKKYSAGNKSMMLAEGFNEAEIAAAEIKDHEAEHVIYFACGKRLLGCLLLSDSLREDALGTVNELKALGKEIHLCTGADETTASKYAKLLGIKKIAANRPAVSSDPKIKTKTTYIEALKSRGHKVAMVGDAANDALAIKKSHFGIAVESNDSHKITRQEAGAVIYKKQNGDLSLGHIVTAFTIANKTIRKIKQNLAFSLSYNIVTLVALGVFVGIGFVLNPAVGALLMVLQAALILGNTYCFSAEKPRYANDPVLTTSPKVMGRSSHSLINQELAILPGNNNRLDNSLVEQTPIIINPINPIPEPSPLPNQNSTAIYPTQTKGYY